MFRKSSQDTIGLARAPRTHRVVTRHRFATSGSGGGTGSLSAAVVPTADVAAASLATARVPDTRSAVAKDTITIAAIAGTCGRNGHRLIVGTDRSPLQRWRPQVCGPRFFALADGEDFPENSNALMSGKNRGKVPSGRWPEAKPLKPFVAGNA